MKAVAVRKEIARKRSPVIKLKPKKDVTDSFNQFKVFEGQQYTGMQVGRSHKWYYDKGEWKDTRITPDVWEISYEVTKRRAGRAPKGSGAAVGTGYHWFILAHQNVKKLNADDYSTSLTGLKYKLAHKRAGKGKWSATTATQRKHLIGFLKEMTRQLEAQPIPLQLLVNDIAYKGEATPILECCHEGMCHQFEIMLNDEPMGIIRYAKSGWKMNAVEDKKLIKEIGKALLAWYEQ